MTIKRIKTDECMQSSYDQFNFLSPEAVLAFGWFAQKETFSVSFENTEETEVYPKC